MPMGIVKSFCFGRRKDFGHFEVFDKEHLLPSPWIEGLLIYSYPADLTDADVFHGLGGPVHWYLAPI